MNPATRIGMSPAQIISVAIGAVLIISALIAGIFVLLVKVPGGLGAEGVEIADKGYDVVQRIGKDVHKLAEDIFDGCTELLNLRPTIVVGSETVYKQDTSISELAIIERRFDYSYFWQHVWLGSTKNIQLKGTFRAKAGYDLTDLTRPFLIAISKDGNAIEAQVPPGKILSNELINLEILQDEGGWWNRMTREDREDAINELNREARLSIGRSDLVAEADKELWNKLDSILRKSRPTVSISRIAPPVPLH